MQTLVVVVLVLIVGITSADARRRKHRVHVYDSYMYMVPRDAVVTRRDRSIGPRPSQETTVAPSDEPRRVRYGSAADLVPPDWQLQPGDPNSKEQRFVSPDGSGWFRAYAIAADPKAVSAHMKGVAFVDGEEITYIRAERSWIAVSGFKGDRTFYRKAVLACAGDRWHHVAFDYPASAKRKMAEFVNRAAEVVQLSGNQDCETPISSR